MWNKPGFWIALPTFEPLLLPTSLVTAPVNPIIPFPGGLVEDIVIEAITAVLLIDLVRAEVEAWAMTLLDVLTNLLTMNAEMLI